jgi:hypothetical protein
LFSRDRNKDEKNYVIERNTWNYSSLCISIYEKQFWNFGCWLSVRANLQTSKPEILKIF